MSRLFYSKVKNSGCFRIGASRRFLNLHEYQCKDLLKLHGLNVQKYVLVGANDKNIPDLNFGEYVVKAQVLAGGRGKGTFKCGFQGGVHLTKDKTKAMDITYKMLNNRLCTAQTGKDGELVKKVMIADALDIKKEMYLAFVLDSEMGGPVLLSSPIGGMNIEQVAKDHPDQLLKIPIDIKSGITEEQCKIVSNFLGLDQNNYSKLINQLKNLYKLFISVDATQVEINPLGISIDDNIVCFDSKISFDDNAKFRQKKIFELEDYSSINSHERIASDFGLNYVHMDGDIACIVNGAGLAMATMDMIYYYGGSPANFLDLSGGVSTEGVRTALGIIAENENCKKLFINIFGGIVDCSVVAKGIVDSVKQYKNQLPHIILRLNGTNSDLAKKIIKTDTYIANNNLITMVQDFSEAAKLACEF